MSFLQLKEIATFWKNNNYCNKIELAALEPFLYHSGGKNIVDVCALFYDFGFNVSVTTNGFYLDKYVNKLIGKVNKIRVSIHSMDKNIYKEIMAFDGYDKVIKGVNLALEAGLNVSINRVLLKGKTFDIEKQLYFVDKNQIKLKLLDLYYTDDIKEFYDIYYISPEEVLKPFIENGLIIFDSTHNFNRDRVVFKTKNKGFVEYKHKADFNKKNNNKICETCSKKNICLEGYADYLRVFPNGKAGFCYIRKELDFDAFDENNKVVLNLNEIYKNTPLRLCITDTCNFNCGFPGDKNSWCLKKFRNFVYLAKR